MNAKFTLAIIALVGIGVFALPTTMSLFAGQHSFYNIDATGNQVPCQKCHGDVRAELGSNAAGPTGSAAAMRSPGPHAAMSCEYCHRIEAGVSSGDDAFWQINYVSGNNRRTMLVSQFDFENGNVPASIGSNQTKAQIQTAWNITFLNAVISDSSDPTNVTTLSQNGESLVQTYYPNGTAKDPNPDTMNSGVRLGSMTALNFTYNGTAQPVINWNRFGSRIVNPGSTYHAASLVSCLECHGRGEPLGHETNRTVGLNGMVNCADCHYGGSANLASEGKAGQAMRNIWAGGFGVTSGRNDSGTSEAHNSWVKTQGASRFGKGNGVVEINNDACIACHTHVAVDINFVKGYKLSISAISGTNSNTGVSQYTVSNAAVEGHVYVSTFGNQSGETFAVGQATYSWTPTGQPLYINGNKTNVLNGLNGDTSDSASALQ